MSTSPPRIALVSDWFAPRRGGIESHLLGLAQSLGAAGVDAHVITCFPGPEVVEGVAVIRVQTPLLPGASIAFSPRLVGRLERLFAAGNFDVIHLHPSIVAPFCLAGLLAAQRLNKPAILTFHSSMERLPRWLNLAHRLSGWAHKGVTLSGVSNTIAKQVQAIDPTAGVLVLPNGHDSAFWAEPAPRAAHMPGVFRVAAGMRLEPTKRPLALLDIFRQADAVLAPRGIRLELAVAGAGSLAGTLDRAVQAAGLANRFTLLGWLDRDGLRELYRTADAYLLPSTRESFGIAALEARSEGLPVLGRAGTGLADYIIDGQDGFLGPDDATLARALVRLATEPALLAALSGPRPALARYDWAEVAATHSALYATLAAP